LAGLFSFSLKSPSLALHRHLKDPNPPTQAKRPYSASTSTPISPLRAVSHVFFQPLSIPQAIEVQVADADKVGYHIDAKTSLGRISLDLPNLAYQVRDEGTVRREILTETSGFSESTDKLTIKARTSNGQIRIARS
jgi:hypothetical protein